MIQSSPLAVALCSAASFLLLPAPAQAQEVFAGAFAHGVNTPLTLDTGERGLDLELGYRFPRLTGVRLIGGPAPYVLASLNTKGETSFVGGGLAWKIGAGPAFVRPGIGLVVHTGPNFRINPRSGLRSDLGSRVLFEPELGIGMHVAPRTTLEASWTHISHAKLFNAEQNPGIDMWGVRLGFAIH
ncbi:MAG: acyloxyacyl hydrolase [Novosphingobium sp.]|nr:acyloxyacyl hydrolase [Novosphingobium sp.]